MPIYHQELAEVFAQGLAPPSNTHTVNRSQQPATTNIYAKPKAREKPNTGNGARQMSHFSMDDSSFVRNPTKLLHFVLKSTTNKQTHTHAESSEGKGSSHAVDVYC